MLGMSDTSGSKIAATWSPRLMGTGEPLANLRSLRTAFEGARSL